MDARFLSELIGALVMLGAFWAYIQAQFVHKDVNDIQMRRIDEKMFDLNVKLDEFKDTAEKNWEIMREMAGKVAVIYRNGNGK